jgi:exosortase/archaeosortase
MKNNKIQDERILLARRKIQSQAYGWLVYALMISIIVQQFFMKAPFAQYAVEFFTLIGCGLYISVRHFKEGVDIWNSKGNGRKKMLLSTIVSGVVSVILFAFLSGIYDMKTLTSYFVSFVIFFFVFRSFIIAINKKKQQAIEDKLSEDEMNE